MVFDQDTNIYTYVYVVHVYSRCCIPGARWYMYMYVCTVYSCIYMYHHHTIRLLVFYMYTCTVHVHVEAIRNLALANSCTLAVHVVH